MFRSGSESFCGSELVDKPRQPVTATVGEVRHEMGLRTSPLVAQRVIAENKGRFFKIESVPGCLIWCVFCH